MCDIGIIQIFVKFGNCFIDCLAEKIDLRTDMHGFAHLHLATAGSAHLLCSNRKRFFDQFKIGNIDLRPENTHLDKQVAFGIR